MSERTPLIFWLLSASALIWLALLAILIKILAKYYPKKYQDMGRPSVFWNYSLEAQWDQWGAKWQLMKFLLKREYTSLYNVSLVILGDFMLVFLLLFIAVLGYIIFSKLFGISIHALLH